MDENRTIVIFYIWSDEPCTAWINLFECWVSMKEQLKLSNLIVVSYKEAAGGLTVKMKTARRKQKGRIERKKGYQQLQGVQ